MYSVKPVHGTTAVLSCVPQVLKPGGAGRGFGAEGGAGAGGFGFTATPPIPGFWRCKLVGGGNESPGLVGRYRLRRYLPTSNRETSHPPVRFMIYIYYDVQSWVWRSTDLPSYRIVRGTTEYCDYLGAGNN